MDLSTQMAHLEERLKINTKRIDILEDRVSKDEDLVNDLDKSLSISMEKIKVIASEILKEKCKELDAKIEKVNEKLDKETTVKDAENWRSSKKQIWSWVLNAILGLVAIALGISKFM